MNTSCRVLGIQLGESILSQAYKTHHDQSHLSYQTQKQKIGPIRPIRPIISSKKIKALIMQCRVPSFCFWDRWDGWDGWDRSPVIGQMGLIGLIMICPIGLMGLILMMHQNLSERNPLVPHQWDNSGSAHNP